MATSNDNTSPCGTFRINEFTIRNEQLKIQLTEKDKAIGQLQRNVSTLEARRMTNGGPEIIDQVDSAQLMGAPPPSALQGDYEKQEREEIDAMHEALRKIASEVQYICRYCDILSDCIDVCNLTVKYKGNTNPVVGGQC